MEKVLIPVSFIGGFLVGRNWKKIVAFSRPYVKKGIKQTQNVVSKSFKGTSNGFKAAGSYFGSQWGKRGNAVARASSLLRRERSKQIIAQKVNRNSSKKSKISRPAVATG